MRLAVVGAGRIGRMHAGIATETPGIGEVIVADIDPERAAAVAASTGAHAAPSVDTALDRSDAVLIASATDAHVAIIRAALARGLPIFCEKPLAGSLGESITIAAEIESAGRPFQLGFQRRFDPAYLRAHEMITTGKLGTLYAIRLAGHDPAPPTESYVAASGGLLRDFSVHDFDLIRWLTGSDVAEVFVMGAIRAFPWFATYDDVDTAVATLRMTDGTLVALTVSRHDPLGYDIRTELFGSRDSVAVGLGPRTPIRSLEPGVPPPAGPAWSHFMERFESAYRAEIAGFVAVASGERSSPCTARDGVEALRTAEAATRSLKESRLVSLAEFLD
jgi:myo-inositol 2-dehydrogenase/D-chiro-inositol 1-dehydrogenase